MAQTELSACHCGCQVSFQASTCGICGGERGSGTGFFLVLYSFPVSIIPPVLHSHISLTTTNAM
jgi:hypothetical protein